MNMHSASDMKVEEIIYVVDDDASIRKSTHFLFRSIGYDQRPFASGRDFLEAVGDLRPGCVLLDLRMPDIDGIEVLTKLGGASSQFPVVVMTGHGDVDVAVRAMKLGAIDFLEKPFGEDVLLEAISRALSIIKSVDERVVLDLDSLGRILTKRQIQVLAGLSEGLTNKTIAASLGIAPRTVEMHRADLMAKLRVKSLAHALRLVLPLNLKM